MIITELVITLLIGTAVSAENILMTEVFAIRIEPGMFNWTYEGDPEQFVYQPSLLNSPDLPAWINYHYSSRYHTGFLYGVPPEDTNKEVVLEIVALNRKNYETQHRILPIHITEKLNPAKSEVHLKIDNLNVEDMFDTERMDRLKDVFRKDLWKDSQDDLYVTFLASAVKLGARLPLNPSEGEGVVLRVGSKAHLSPELLKLQKEVKPLWKHTSCPRDFKRTTVERTFRDAGFALDWCAFRLIEDSSSPMQQHSSSQDRMPHLEDRWESFSIDEVPQRLYTREAAYTIVIPTSIMILLALALSLVLCFHHDGIEDEESEDFFHNIFHICIDYYRSRSIEETIRCEINNYTAPTVRCMSNSGDISCLSPEMATRSRTESPTSTVRGIHCRPSPPPYVRPKFKSEL